MADEVVAATKLADTLKSMAAAGIEPMGGGSEDYAKAIAGENARMAKAIDAASIKPE